MKLKRWKYTKKDYVNKLSEIAYAVNGINEAKMGLLDGQGGIALFELYYAKQLNKEYALDHAILSIQKIYSSLEMETNPSLSNVPD